MSNVQTILRKRNITPQQVGRMVLSDFLTTRRNFLEDPSIRSGSLEPTEKQLLITRANMSPNRLDMVVYLVLRDFLHELSFRQELAVQGFEVAYSKLSHLVQMATVAESMNLLRIEKKTRTSTPLFEAYRAESLLNGKNIIQEHVKSMKRSIATLTAFNTGLECICRVTGMESIRGEITPLSGMYYDIGELQSAVDDLLGSIVRDGKEPVPVMFLGGVPNNPSEWLLAIELSETGQRIEAEDLKKELRGILSVNVDLDQTAIKLYEKTFSLQKILKDGIADLEKLTNNLIRKDVS